MSNVPLSTRFVGFSPIANLDERKSEFLNSISQPFSMQDIAQSAGGGTVSTGIPFNWYPPATILDNGPKFTYTDGVELISYHIKGIIPVSGSEQSSEMYICTISFPQEIPFLFPGSIKGMFQVQQGQDFIHTPLSDGGLVDVEGTLSPAGGVKFSLYSYGNNPQISGSYDYALVLSFGVSNDGNISGLASYDYEFLLPNFIATPTIYQD
jgi:hypothetical protein